jgi:hypothetical protein
MEGTAAKACSISSNPSIGEAEEDRRHSIEDSTAPEGNGKGEKCPLAVYL